MYPKNHTIKKEFDNRLQINGVFPDPDIFIKNLTSNDTGPYWCLYAKTDQKLKEIQENEGQGSMLLVVLGESKSSMP